MTQAFRHRNAGCARCGAGSNRAADLSRRDRPPPASGILYLVLALALALSLTPWARDAHAHDVATRPAPTKVIGTYRDLIERKIDTYNDTFPEIRFVHLEGGDIWHGEMIALVALLGGESEPVDYAHPPHLRRPLLEATLERLVHMLRRNILSATTFRLPADNPTARRHLCIITLNPQQSVTDDVETTRHMLNLGDEDLHKVHPARYLNHVDHLEFAIDHEAFHCLDSVYYGGAPMTKAELDGAYHQWRRESAADAFALAMHIRARGAITSYARNITHMRALWLLGDSPDHSTFETLREIVKSDPATIAALTTREIMALARQTADRTVGAYDNYLDRRLAALKAAHMLGLTPRVPADVRSALDARPADSAQANLLVRRYHYYYDQLFTDTPISLQGPP